MLNLRGKLIGDFTIANAGSDRYYVFGSGVAEQYHLRWLEARLPADGVKLRSLRTELLGLAIAGPKAPTAAKSPNTALFRCVATYLTLNLPVLASPYLILSCLTLPCLALPCLTLPNLTLPCPALPLPYLTLPCLA